MKKIALTGLLIAGVVGLGFGLRSQLVVVPTPVPQINEVRKPVTLMIDFGDFIATRSVEMTSSLTAYSSLLTEDEFTLDTQKYDFGVFVKSINGYESGKDKAWIYFVNGKLGDMAADKYFVKPGDKVEWKYVKPQ